MALQPSSKSLEKGLVDLAQIERRDSQLWWLAITIIIVLTITVTAVDTCSVVGDAKAWKIDLGNIGTPDEVLDKPGALTEVEWVDILRHPDVGSNMLSQVPALSQVASIVRHHHERYDGKGYPDGLSGDAIPLLSRVVSIADAYEAMTADRSFRLAKSHEQAIRELRLNAGEQFDPMLLERFIAAVDDFEAGRKAA